MTEVVGKLWQDGESKAQKKDFHEAMLSFQRAKALLIKESAVMFENPTKNTGESKASKLMGSIMEKLHRSISRVSEILSKDPILALQLPRDYSKSDIKKAYRKQALKYHPDKNTDCDTTAIFTAVHTAYEKLLAAAASNPSISGTSGGSSSGHPGAGSRKTSTGSKGGHGQSSSGTGTGGTQTSELSSDVLKAILKKFGVCLLV